MNRSLSIVLVIIVALAAGAAGIYSARHEAPPATAPAASPEQQAALDKLLALELPDSGSAKQPLANWKGKVLVVNFWASCCLPCQREIPAFIALQDKHGGRGLQFVGIAMEEADKAGAYAARVGMNYPILRGDTAGAQLGRDAGNQMGGMPYTVVFDRRGNAIAALTGEVDSARLENLILPLL